MTSKSATGDVEVSPGIVAGRSVTQPRRGSHASSGKNEPSRKTSPVFAIRSNAPAGSCSVQGSETVTASLPEAAQRALEEASVCHVAAATDAGHSRPVFSPR